MHMIETGLNLSPHIRTTGSGPTVLCLHSSTSSSRQWTGLMELLGSQYRVAAVDLFGYGRTLPWPGHRHLTLEDEVGLLAPILASSDSPVHLIGHSYGGAVAARAALMFPERIASLTLYEPVLFNLLFDDDESIEESREIRAVDRTVRERVSTGNFAGATQHFIDYWSGAGVWESLPDWRRENLTVKITKVVSDFDAVFGNDTPLSDFRVFTRPTLLLYGLQSPRTSRRVVKLLSESLSRVETRGLLGVGHMGPVTHADQVNYLCKRFVRAVSTPRPISAVTPVAASRSATA